MRRLVCLLRGHELRLSRIARDGALWPALLEVRCRRCGTARGVG